MLDTVETVLHLWLTFKSHNQCSCFVNACRTCFLFPSMACLARHTGRDQTAALATSCPQCCGVDNFICRSLDFLSKMMKEGQIPHFVCSYSFVCTIHIFQYQKGKNLLSDCFFRWLAPHAVATPYCQKMHRPHIQPMLIFNKKCSFINVFSSSKGDRASPHLLALG